TWNGDEIESSSGVLAGGVASDTAVVEQGPASSDI
ncbi:unnamed protein product, partial [Pylaiella littoralis]